ncbi:hypothetical protein WOB59_18745 [Methylocystis sp. IM4]|uniref:hypothetical protein n=1 Tax=Methylocystis sp. IM4 TaxID=3136560 RepID=UPI00311A75C0
MRTGISITLEPPDRERLQAIVKNRNAAQMHVSRAEIVLPRADGIATNEIIAAHRQLQDRRLALAGVVDAGRLRRPPAREDPHAPPRIPPLGAEVAERVVAVRLQDPPGEATQ